jgi:hypothetical protein
MAEPGFEWTELYPQIAEKLFDKKDDTPEARAKFLERVCKIIGDVPQSIAGKNDPFSFFELFHGGLSSPTLQKRLKKCTKELLEESKLPTVVHGIPSINFRQFAFNKTKQEDGNPNAGIREVLWNFFVAAMKYANASEDEKKNGASEVFRGFKHAFSTIQANNQFKPTTAMVLFMMRPDTFLTLDDNMRAYLKANVSEPEGWPKGAGLPTYAAVLRGGKVPSADQYLLLCSHVRGKLELGELKTPDGDPIEDFAHLSHIARLAGTKDKRGK